MKIKHFHQTTAWVCIITFICHFGCASSTKPPPRDFRLTPHKIAIVSGTYDPEINFRGADKHYVIDSLKTAGIVYLPFIEIGGAFVKAGAEAGEMSILAAPIFGLGVVIMAAGLPFALIGGAAGAANARTKAGVLESKKKAEEAMVVIQGQFALRDKVLEEAKRRTHHTVVAVDNIGPQNPGEIVDYSSLKGRGFDSVLEVGFIEIENSIEKYRNPAISLLITVNARLIRVSDNEELFDETFEFHSHRRYLATWLGLDPLSLSRNFDRMTAQLSEKIVDEVFLISPDQKIPVPKPLHPRDEDVEWPQIDTLRPKFTWTISSKENESEGDASDNFEEMKYLKYDLKIARVNGELQNLEPVLVKTDIERPYYRLEDALEPGTKYCWCVRAKIDEGSHAEVSPWSAASSGGRLLSTQPNNYSHKFKTYDNKIDRDAQSLKIASRQSETAVRDMETHKKVDVTVTQSISAAPEETTPKIPSNAEIYCEIVARDGRFEKLANGVVHDTRTGLEWYAGPEHDTDYSAAKRWIKSLKIDGGGWRMPTVEELKSLYQKGIGKRNRTSLLDTTARYVWTGDSRVSSKPYDFDSNTTYAGRLDRQYWLYNTRAFAVRARK
jgi:hypothetical protein